MEIRKIDMSSRRRKLRAFAVAILLLLLFSAIITFAEQHPVIGYSSLYILASAVPFLFGLYWDSRLITRNDRMQLQKKHPFSSIIAYAVLYALLNTITRAIDGKFHSNSESFIYMITSVGGALAGLSACSYLPFFLGRMIARRIDLHAKGNA